MSNIECILIACLGVLLGYIFLMLYLVYKEHRSSRVQYYNLLKAARDIELTSVRALEQLIKTDPAKIGAVGINALSRAAVATKDTSPANDFERQAKLNEAKINKKILDMNNKIENFTGCTCTMSAAGTVTQMHNPPKSPSTLTTPSTPSETVNKKRKGRQK